MVDLTTLEGADTPGKVRGLCVKARQPDPADPAVPPVAAVCVYPDLVAVARFRVTVDGSAQVELTQPTGDPDLNRALVETLKRWRFFPAMQSGKPILSTIDIRIPISVK